ncbi:MAG: AI-2E family transporter [Acetobacteraceae bacterium]
MAAGSWFAYPEDQGGRRRFALTIVLAAAGVWVGLFVAWQVREALLLTFAAVVGAILLLAAAEPIERRTGLSRPWSLAMIAAVLLIVLCGAAWLLGNRLQVEISDLNERLKPALQSLTGKLGLPEQGNSAVQGGGFGLSDLVSVLQQVLGSFVSAGGAIAGGLLSTVLVIVGAFFIAASPDTYRVGVVKLFPKPQHARVEDAMRTSGEALRRWLLAQLIAMAVVGVLVFLGTWIIGLPAPLALGLFAGLAEFVPLIGPIAGAVPAVLLAATQGVWTTFWTVLLFIVIQQIESNLVTPLVQGRMTQIPPALLLFAVLAVGLLFGVTGIVVAAPLTVLLYVLVTKLYVRETLGEEATVPGEG